MEMAEYRDDGIWEVVPNNTTPVNLVEPGRPRSRRHRPRQPRAHRGGPDGPPIPPPRPWLAGWALVFAGTSNVGLIVVTVLVGLSPLALVALAALALSSWLLVVAEIVSIQRLYDEDANTDQ